MLKGKFFTNLQLCYFFVWTFAKHYTLAICEYIWDNKFSHLSVFSILLFKNREALIYRKNEWALFSDISSPSDYDSNILLC